MNAFRRILLAAFFLGATALPLPAESETDEQLVAKAARLVKRHTGLTNTVRAEVRTDRKDYRAGDFLRAHLTVSPGSFVRLYYKSAGGDVIVLFPNEDAPDPRVGGDGSRTIPSEEDGFDIEIFGPPFGTEYLILVASDRPFLNEADLELPAAVARDEFVTEGELSPEDIVLKGARAVLTPAPDSPSAAAPGEVPSKEGKVLDANTTQLGFAITQITTRE